VVEISDSKSYTATGEKDLFNVVDPYVAYLKQLTVTNSAAALATVKVLYYNGTAKKTVKEVKVASDETLILEARDLPREACPTKIVVDSDQQPYTVAYTVELV